MSADAVPFEPTQLNRSWNCHLTTTGRKSGAPRRVTIWFVADAGVVYLTGGADEPHWCRNLRANPAVTVEIGGQTFRGRARVEAEPAAAEAIRRRFTGKYLLARISKLFGGYTRSVPVIIDVTGD